jgi:hypothetical protein
MCAPKGTLTLPDGQDIVLWRNERRKFLCYCSNPTCPKSSGFTTLDGLKQHMKNLKTIWLGLEKTTIFSTAPSGTQTESLTIQKGTATASIEHLSA